MESLKTWMLRLLIYIFNATHKVLKSTGLEILPLTVENVFKGLTPIEKDEALRKDFMDPLRIALDCFNSFEATGIQRSMMLDKFRRYAKTRAAVKQEIRKNPDILKTPLDGPIVIIGLARSGTTMLQRLLSCDPRFVSPMTWEMFLPYPPGRPQNWRECDRFKTVKRQFDLFRPVFPALDEMNKIHAIGPELPEECVITMHNYFMEVPDAAFPAMERYRQFMLQAPRQHVRNMYDFYKKALQCIFFKNLDDDKRLLLKCPFHLNNLDLYREAMPNAKFIFTYRNINSILTSTCSLFEMGQRITNLPFDKKYAGRTCLDIFRYASSRGIGTFKDIPKDSLVCMGYTELLQDPLEAVKKIYSHFNIDLPPEVVTAMQRHMAEHKQNKHGKHNYGTIADYGITEDDIREAMPEFFEYFKDSQEKLL